MLAKTVFLIGAFIASANAYVEETCFYPNDVKALYQTSIDLKCPVGSSRPGCLASASFSSTRVFGANWCRGFVHYDAIYFMAQALGMSRSLKLLTKKGYSPEAAYWISTMSVNTDYNQFMATTSCGEPMPDAFQPPPLRGLMRLSTITGGYIRHLGVLYGVKRPATSALNPNTKDYKAEGMLAQARDWAFGNSDLLCTVGLTYPDKNGNVFKGTKCLDDGSFIEGTAYPEWMVPIIYGPIPVAEANVTFGPQIAHYDCTNDTDCSNPTPENMVNIITAPGMYKYVKSTPYAKTSDNKTIPELWLRFGVYLHQLSDRNSHYFMTNKPNTAIVPPTNKTSKVYRLIWDAETSNFISHANGHAGEQMLKPGIPVQTWATLNNYYSELSQFKTRHAKSNPKWFVTKYTPLSKSQLVGTKNKPGILVRLAEMQDIVARMKSFMSELKKHSYAQVPGQEKPCDAWTSPKTEL
jgi:hypothetical protein